MIEAEQSIRPLELVFNQESVENLRNKGVTGVVTLEVHIGDLLAAAETKGISIYGLGAFDHEPKVDHCLVLSPDRNTVPSFTLFVKDVVVYVAAEELEAFKEIFLER